MLIHRIRETKKGETVQLIEGINNEWMEQLVMDRLLKGIDPNGGITEIIVNLSVRTVRTYSQNNENGTNTR